MFRSAALLLIAAGGIGACVEPTGVSLPERARLLAVDAPDSIPASVALTVHVTFELGRCDRLLRVQGRNVDGAIEIEVQKRYDLPPGSGGCPDIGPFELTAPVHLALQPVGTLTVRGLQPDGLDPLERRVIVQPD